MCSVSYLSGFLEAFASNLFEASSIKVYGLYLGNSRHYLLSGMLSLQDEWSFELTGEVVIVASILCMSDQGSLGSPGKGPEGS